LRSGEVQALADAAVPEGEGWGWNQSLLDLGATVCRAHGPQCESCPWARSCAWAAAGCPPPDPASGSAHTSRPQSPFVGSDRQGRGRLVRALGRGPVSAGDLGATVTEINGASHVVMISHPKEVAQVVMTAVRTLR
jgi:A/G-specific adenine glycosylase